MSLGEKAFVNTVDPSCAFAQRLIEMGFSNGTEVEVVIRGISKHLKAYKIKNTVVAIRDELAEKINVILISER
ncbi:MAG: ferrous iron transport protein A [Ruminococcus sp.]|nr:ferrous iron transport protein A [Ruminococcus sp.]